MLTEAEGDVAGEMECEMQARDFFIHIGMLIVEGRTPQQSDKGRVEGPHCLSLISVVPHHVCNPHVNYLVSAHVSELREWFQKVSLYPLEGLNSKSQQWLGS